MAAGYWLRLWTETPNDPKFRSIAKISGQHITVVLSVFMHMLCCAKTSSEQGTLFGWVDDDIAAALDLEPEQVVAIRTAMQGKILDGDRMHNWEKRQPNREDDSRDRVAACRARQKERTSNTSGNAEQDNVTHCNAPETETETETEEDKNVISSPNGDSSPELFGDGDLANDGGEERAAKTQVPYQQIVELYHECCPSLARVRQLTKKRRQLIKARWPGSIEPFRLVFSRAEQSDFLTGRKPSRDHPSWVADLEFILREESWAKISEGKYDNRAALALSIEKLPRGIVSILETVQRKEGGVYYDRQGNGANRHACIGGISGDAKQGDGFGR